MCILFYSSLEGKGNVEVSMQFATEETAAQGAATGSRCMRETVSTAHCGSALGPGAFGLPYYCAPLVCIPAELGEVAVWIKKKTQKPKIQED